MSNIRRFDTPGIRTKLFIGRETVGIGKIELLEAIAETGSISAAAASMGMDYRRAWLLLKSTQDAFSVPLFVTQRGGSGRGGALLTPEGEELIRSYRDTMRRVEREFAPMLDWVERHQQPVADEDDNN